MNIFFIVPNNTIGGCNMIDKRKVNNTSLVKEIIETFVDSSSIRSDPNGSYTGKGEDPYEKPVQDQDDL